MKIVQKYQNGCLVKAQKIIDKDIKPILQEHGGNITVLREEDGILYLKMEGHCCGCPSAWMTVEEIVKTPLLSKMEELKDVIVENTIDEELLQLARDILSGKGLSGESYAD